VQADQTPAGRQRVARRAVTREERQQRRLCPHLHLRIGQPLPEPLKPLLRRLLDKDPANRPGSAGELLTELEKVAGRTRASKQREVSEGYVLGSRSVGRSAELARLQELFSQRVLDPRPGAPAVLLVTGASGTGRSRLLQELRHQVQLRRVRFHQDETFTGLFVPLYARMRLRRTRDGFSQVNEALRERADTFVADDKDAREPAQ
jgi:hypothetical protein